MGGFGPVEVERDEPVFHEPLGGAGLRAERRSASCALRAYNVDEYRHAVERMDPAHYLGGVVLRARAHRRGDAAGREGRRHPRRSSKRARAARSRSRGRWPRSRRPSCVAPPQGALRGRRRRSSCATSTRAATRARPRYVRGKRGVVVHVAPKFVVPRHRGARARAARGAHLPREFEARELWADAAGQRRDRRRRPLGQLPGGYAVSRRRSPVPPAPPAARAAALADALAEKQLVPDGFLDEDGRARRGELEPAQRRAGGGARVDRSRTTASACSRTAPPPAPSSASRARRASTSWCSRTRRTCTT